MRILCGVAIFVCLAMSLGIRARGQELPENPVPTRGEPTLRPLIAIAGSRTNKITSLPKPVFREPWWKLDKDVATLGAIHGAASVMDGITTTQGPAYLQEGDPVARLFLGRRGTWSRMLPLGSLEVFGTALLAQRMKHSSWKLARRLYVAPQILAIAWHTEEGSQNVLLTNYCHTSWAYCH